ncbi:MAG: DNA repair protein RecN [Lentisphaerae bacterium GWF2_49_21]|nr:MAG: DNA repair protein RecN [Lentisphaerae bacterium GWF2_49_21]
MIEWIRIKNLALIEEAEIEFKPGFNVITGETGAGKTILIGAIGMLLGERADKTSIRTGCSSCEISMSFALPKSVAKSVSEILDSAGLPPVEDKVIQLKRILTATSSRNFVNDSSASLQTLKTLGNILIDTHGPHEHQSLLKQSIQLELIDRYGSLEKITSEASEIFEGFKKTKFEREELEKGIPSSSEAEHFRFIVSDIAKAGIHADEEEELVTRHNLASNSHDILETATNAVGMLKESEGSLTDRISEIYRVIQGFEGADPDMAAKFLKQCESLTETANELVEGIQRYTGNIELDEKEFTELEERIRIIQNLKRRYGPTLADVIKTAENARIKLDEFENFESIRTSFIEKEKSLNDKLLKKCSEISKKRHEISAKFAKKVCAELRKLGFARSDFTVDFKQTEPGPTGSDVVDFIFSPNPGETAKPLREIASSGEISRVMLALKTVLSSADSIPVLVFDEIDVNIGGETAMIVGQELKALGSSHQVLCISHLPQVAACADTHYSVEKSVVKGRTFTAVSELKDTDRKSEIARMLGGGKAAEKHAEEMLSGK